MQALHFKDRADAGRQLATMLLPRASSDVVVYALPRGGVVTAVEIARELNAPFDLIIPRKIGHPSNPEYAIAAVAEDGHMIASPDASEFLNTSWFRTEVERQRTEARRRREIYLPESYRIDPSGKTAIIVDDGVATGLTMRCAINELKHRTPQQIIVAVPVASPDSLALISPLVDSVVCLTTPRSVDAIGSFYDSFPQVEDAEVITLIQSLI